MSTPPARRNVRPAVWLGISLIGFAAAIALANGALALLASLALVGALASVERFPPNRD